MSKILISVALGCAFIAAGCSSTSKNVSSSSTSTASGTPTGSAGAGPSTGTPINVGFIYSATGAAQSSYQNSEFGAQARVDALNAAGGVEGHPIHLIIKDDQSTPTGNLTDAQLLVQTDNAFAIIDDSLLAFASAKYLHEEGIPVFGAAIDGPEWATPPNTNMFSVFPVTTGPIGGKYHGYNTAVPFLKSLGVTRMGALGSNFPSVVATENELLKSAEGAGMTKCYQNHTLPVGPTDFTSIVLQLKGVNCNGLWAGIQLAASISLAQGLKNAGLHPVQLYTAVYDQDLLNQPQALASMAGTYTTSPYTTTPPNGAASVMLKRLKQYTSFSGQIPSLTIVFAYADADLLALGLQTAGKSSSRQQVISDLRQVGNYTAEGLLATAISYKNFGTGGMFVPKGCTYVFKIESSGFQPTNGGKPYCGNLVSVG
jgi:branched-chain amino acid transport system substrate-binding protein